jgi:hypothetical protein
MFAKMARGTFLVLLAVMVVTWVFALRNSGASEQQNDDLWKEPWSISV